MKLRYEKIISYHNSLVSRITESQKVICDLILPRKVSAAIARNIDALEHEIDLWNKQRNDIVMRYTKKNDIGQPLVDEDSCYVFETYENKMMFLQEQRELNEIEVDVPIVTFGSSALDLCDSSERYDILTPKQESLISWMIDYSA